MSTHWQVQEAKQKFSELLRSVETDGPAFVTKHGVEVAVVIPIEEYRELHKGSKPSRDENPYKGMSFDEWLLAGPSFEDLEPYLERDQSPPREVDLSEWE